MTQDRAVPQPFHGLFWQPGKRMDHIIVDWEPARVCRLLGRLPPSDPYSDPAFLVGGACLDLQRNGHVEKAKGLMAAAKANWPQFNWDFMERFVGRMAGQLPPVADGMPPFEARNALYGLLEFAAAVTRGKIPPPESL